MAWTEAEKLQAITARIQGTWDDPALMKLGPLTWLRRDILRIMDGFEGPGDMTPPDKRCGTCIHWQQYNLPPHDSPPEGDCTWKEYPDSWAVRVSVSVRPGMALLMSDSEGTECPCWEGEEA